MPIMGNIKGNNMKVRNGFVSNSSSSSFMIVGFRPNDENLASIIEQLNLYKQLDINKLELENNGEELSDFIYLSYGEEYINDKLSMIKSYEDGLLIGFNNCHQELETKNVSMIREEFIKYIKDTFNIEIHPSTVGIYSGQCGNE